MSPPACILGFLGIVGLLTGIGFSLALWPMGLIIPATSLALLLFAYGYPRFQNWIEFGEQIKVRGITGVEIYDWRDVVSISYEFDMGADDSARHVWLDIGGNRKRRLSFFPSELEKIAKSLSTGLYSQEPEIRESVVHGLSRLGCTEYFVLESADGYIRSYDESVVGLRKEIASHLEEVLGDSDERVRAAAADALSSIRVYISEEQS